MRSAVVRLSKQYLTVHVEHDTYDELYTPIQGGPRYSARMSSAFLSLVSP